MGRHRTNYALLGATGDTPRDRQGKPVEPSWDLKHRTEYTQMVGRRIRRIREGLELTQGHLGQQARKPNGDRYSPGMISRMERGHANPPIYAYVDVAAVLDIAPGVLLGPRSVEDPIEEGELTLVRFLRRIGMTPDEALALIARPGEASLEGPLT
jgi:transcriptional regulator with XRE-family HTH domain